AEPKPLRFGTTSRFQGKSVVFTGNLCCAMRCEAQQAVAALGGSCKSTVSRKTDIVVFGLYDHDTLKPGASIGAKLEEAYTLVSQGYQIEILDENDFLEILYENLDA
ncbi:MAG TPA: BRCT domain-containing protein, partial [Candidatus Limnocylindria bacterium]|nr:BRCT domain-containing protein [Candidatus Limnocylindria bacterium]